jgi:DNA-binding NtrC family response regulator
VPLLAEHLLLQIAERAGHPKKRLSPRALARLASAPMPGNVRQLEHVLVNACVMSDGDVIEAKHLPLDDGMTAESLVELPQEPDDVSGGAPGERPDRAPAGAMGAALPANEEEWKTEERRRILAALEAASWNRLRAAESLGMPRRTFYRRLKEYGILAS